MAVRNFQVAGHIGANIKNVFATVHDDIFGTKLNTFITVDYRTFLIEKVISRKHN